MPRKRRVRKKFHFWLNVSNDGDRQMSDYLESLRVTKGKDMTGCIRNGIKLYAALKDRGDIEVLFEMFPWVKEILLPQIDAVVALQNQMSLLEKALLNSGHTVIPFSKSLSSLYDDEGDTEPLLLQVATNDEKGEDSASALLQSFAEVCQ